jgi:hypothetical protein
LELLFGAIWLARNGTLAAQCPNTDGLCARRARSALRTKKDPVPDESEIRLRFDDA